MANSIHSVIPISRDDSRPALLCPVCGTDYVHPVGVAVLPAGALRAEVTVRADGLHIDRPVAPVGRGVLIRLMFQCESRHAFTYHLHWHKGQTYLSGVSARAKDDWPNTIWGR